MADSEKLNYVATDEMNAGLSFDSNDSVMDKLQGLKSRISVLNDNYQNFTAATKQGLARIKSIISDKMKDHLKSCMADHIEFQKGVGKLEQLTKNRDKMISSINKDGDNKLLTEYQLLDVANLTALAKSEDPEDKNKLKELQSQVKDMGFVLESAQTIDKEIGSVVDNLNELQTRMKQDNEQIWSDVSALEDQISELEKELKSAATKEDEEEKEETPAEQTITNDGDSTKEEQKENNDDSSNDNSSNAAANSLADVIGTEEDNDAQKEAERIQANLDKFEESTSSDSTSTPGENVAPSIQDLVDSNNTPTVTKDDMDIGNNNKSLTDTVKTSNEAPFGGKRKSKKTKRKRRTRRKGKKSKKRKSRTTKK